ncbi:MAG: T9SS type A sorting domain-containing protein [Bacteroidota bacterium]
MPQLRYPLLGLVLSLLLLPLPLRAQTTARANLNVVTETVRADFPDAVLLGMAATRVEPNGEAPAWLYLYGVGDGTFVGVFRADNTIFSQAVSLNGLGLASELLDFNTGDLGDLADTLPLLPIEGDWRDSDGALAAVDNAGGEAFRNDEPNVWTSMLLLDLPAQLLLGRDLPGLDELGPYWLTAYTALPSFQTRLYVTEDQSGLTLSFDAQRTGIVPTNLADEVEDFASDAVLLSINTVLPDLSQAGTSLLWQYTYYSAGRDRARAFMLGPGDQVVARMDAAVPDAPVALPTAHVMANAAWAAVGFRPTGADAGPFVQARLHTLDGEAVWTFDVFGLDTETGLETQTFHVNATTGQPTRTSTEAATLPTEIALSANYPNPFNPSTTIGFSLPQTAAVSLVVYDMLGRPVQTLVDGTVNAGSHQITFEAGNLPSGTYLYRLDAGGETFTRLLTLLK